MSVFLVVFLYPSWYKSSGLWNDVGHALARVPTHVETIWGLPSVIWAKYFTQPKTFLNLGIKLLDNVWLTNSSVWFKQPWKLPNKSHIIKVEYMLKSFVIGFLFSLHIFKFNYDQSLLVRKEKIVNQLNPFIEKTFKNVQINNKKTWLVIKENYKYTKKIHLRRLTSDISHHKYG